ncbi:MAG TPA: aspartate--tRNA(Asn) ligase [Candidatus Obscuribacterales bacterium]
MQSILSSEAQQQLRRTVQVRGHVQAIRKLGNLAFLVIRDRSGSIQAVAEHPDVLAVVEQLSAETPVIVTGEIAEHPGNGGGVELHIRELKPMAKTVGSPPVEIAKNKKVDELSISTLLDYRPLTLRNEKVRAIFKIEAAFCRAFRAFLTAEGFTEIHSPKIVATGTEGGAQLFALKYFEKQAFLAQSPQFYKQIMVGAFERVYEIGPVYRAEEHDTTRHLNEYVSMDVEMGFIESEQDLMDLETRLLEAMFAELQNTCERELALYAVQLPAIGKIPSLKLGEAIALLQQQYRWKAEAKTPDLDPEGERLLSEHFKKNENTDFVFVTHYPHSVRPFYAMPEKGTGLSYSFDLLYRGLEVTTGGQRIHEYEQLCESIRARGLQPESFTDYLQCFKYGMPPHGGFAIGLERLTKQLLGLPSVKQTALFPRDINRLTP